MPPSACPGQLDPSEETEVSERLSQDLLGGWRKTRTSRTLQWPGERSGGPRVLGGPMQAEDLRAATGTATGPAHQAADVATPDAAFRQQDYEILGPRGSQGRRLAPSSPEVCSARGVLARPTSPGHSTHQVDDGDDQQAANGQDGQGHPKQGLRLHALGDGSQHPPGRAAPLWNHSVITEHPQHPEGPGRAGEGAHSPGAE